MAAGSMEEEWSRTSDNILHLTLEIITLLTGERRSPSHGNHDVKNEIPEQCGILEDLEDHSEAEMEDQPRGGSDKRTPPERRLHPPHHPGDSIHEGHPAGEFWERDPLERPPHLHYSKSFIQEEHEIPDHDQCKEGTSGNFTEQGTSISHHSNEDLEMRVVVKEEEEEGLWTAGDLDHGPLSVGNAPEETLRSSPECNQDGDNLDVSSKEDPATPSFHPTFPITPSFYPALPTNLSFHPTFPITPSFYPALPSSGRSADPASQERSSEDRPPRGPRECPVCGKCFTSKTAYNNHRRVHSENRPYCCSVCGKRFKQKIHLVTHQEGHVRKQSLTCPMCGKHFENKVHFALHQRYHAGDAIHTCPECGKEYPSKSKLNQHQKRHMTEKPFACTECDYRGWFRSDLVLHFRTHTGEKPFVCSECGKSFRGKFLLRRHQSKKH